MAYSTIRKGSTGDDVTQLQTSLNNIGGYGLAVDGIFGNNTHNAVTDYQSKNGLAVDGIVGPNTWGSINNSGAQTPAQQSQSSTTTTTPARDPKDYSQYQYDPSTNQAYLNAMSYLDQVKGQSPTFNDTYGGQLDSLYNQIVNRPKFQYDINSDMLYQQAKDQYVNLGQQAMMDTMGQAAALTGGYGSSYGQSVGQQQYDAYLKQLNDNIPEYYNMALQQYQQEGQDLQNQFSMLGNLDSREYGHYQDDRSDWWNQMNFATNERDTAYNQGFQNFANAQQFGLSNEQYQYQIQQDNWGKIEGLITSTGYNPTDEELASAGMTRPQADALRNAWLMAQQTGGSGGGGGGGRGKSSKNTASNNGLNAAKGAMDAFPNKVPLDSRTLDNWFANNGIGGEDAQYAKAYLKENGWKYSRG